MYQLFYLRYMLPELAFSPTTLSTAWRCIAYDYTGRPWTGTIIYDSQDNAVRAINRIEARIQSGDNFMIEMVEGSLPEDEYSHAIAMPA